MNEDAYKKNNRPELGGQPGVYGHPLTKTTLVATSFPQADAFLRQGWNWISELPKDVGVKEAGADNSNDVSPATAGDVQRLEAELAAAKEALAQATAQSKDNAKKADKAAKADAKETVERENARKAQAEAQSKSDEKLAEANKTLKENK